MKTTLLISALAVAGTGAAVAGGVALNDPASGQLADSASDAPSGHTTPDPSLLAQRNGTGESVSRSMDRETTATRLAADRRSKADPEKAAALSSLAGDRTSALTRTEDLGGGDPKSIASALLSSYGWSGDQFGCLDSLWSKESGWRVNAYNPSGAYGIPQALPGSKMSSAGADWQSSAETQIKWGLGYIQDRYGSPCGAWSHSESYNWY